MTREALRYPIPSEAALEPPAEWTSLRNECPVARVALVSGDEAMAEQFVGEMVAEGAPADLKADLGFPPPMWVICDMLGVPDADRDRFAHWSDMMLSITRYTQTEMPAGQAAFGAYMAARIRAKRDQPGEDLLSVLIAERDVGGQPLSDGVLIATGIGLLVTGHETTANMIGKMVAMLLTAAAGRSCWLTGRWCAPRLRRSASSTTPTGSTCAAGPTRTWPSVPARTPVSASRWPEPSCGRCSTCCCASCRRSSSRSRWTSCVGSRGLVVGGLRELPVRW